MPSLVVYWCRFTQIRCCFRGMWTFPLVSENHLLVWDVSFMILIKVYVSLFICIHMVANASWCPLLTIQQRFSLSECICQKRYIISVVHFRNCLCGVSSASCLCQCKDLFFIKSIDVRSNGSRQIMNRYKANVSPCRTLATMSKNSGLSIRCAKT